MTQITLDQAEREALAALKQARLAIAVADQIAELAGLGSQVLACTAQAKREITEAINILTASDEP